MAGAWATLTVKDAAGTNRTMRVWDEAGDGSGPFSFAQVTADGNGTSSATLLTPKFVKIAASNNGAGNDIVAAVGGKRIRVLSWDIKVNGAVNFKWQSNQATDLTDLYYNFAGGDGVVKNYSPVGHFQTAVGEKLSLNLSGAVACGGSLVYVEV